MEAFATLVFVAALVAIAFDWAHRTKIALGGAAVMIVAGVLDEEHAIEAIDWPTIGLLTGMMIIVALSEPTGIFTYLALRATQLSRGNPLALVLLLALVTGVLSAFLDNLTSILLVVPITLLIADILRLPPVPLVIVQILASNIGGTATLIGDPPNILIGASQPELSFMDFIVNLAPVSAVTLLVVSGLLALVYRSSLRADPERRQEIAKLDPAREMREARNVKRTLAVLVGTILAFFAHSAIGVEPAVVAMVGATVMLFVAADDIDEALARVQWTTLLFFIGLFVMVGGLEEKGVIADIADALARLTESDAAEGMVVLWGAAAGSALVDNIPFTTAMIPVVEEIQGGQFDDGLWWALSLGACYGGNATMIAAAANVAATGILERTGHPVSFLQFLAIGLPMTIVSLLIATAYLLLFQF
ncbi:MAG: ArsB/NhaD family transporter [Thermoleophilia bacterium]|nr:ArsB/NhaD family transporter [Gaiellaceae bacterium]MDW8338237.1 ArsB/NhaD family transporter [Thermoleophilia bacterium]